MTRARDLATSAINAFTDADHTHLNNIEANADVTDATNVVAALTAGTNVAIASDGTVSSADTTKLPLTGGTVTGDIDLLQAKHIRWKHEAGGTLRASISAEENDKLQLNTGVSETARMTIDTDGKVGIGVTAPDYALDVSSTVQIRSGEALRLQNAAGNGAATLQCAGAGTNSDLGFSTAGTTRMLIDTSGNVGIKTDAPSSYAATELVVAAADDGGITLVAAATGHKQNIFFADGTIGSAAKRGNLSYDHNLDQLSMGTAAGSARFVMDTNGIVTIPSQPSFFTTGTNYTQANYNGGASTIVQATTVANVGGHMASTGIFTAPVAGQYFFSFFGLSYPHGNHVNQVRFLKNNVLYGQSIQFAGNSAQHVLASGSIIIELAEGNNVRLAYFQTNGSSGKAYPTQWNMCGYLLG